MLRRRQLCALFLIGALSISTAGAYYHFIHYTAKSAPYLPIPEKFDLRALPSQTVTFFVSDAGPARYAPNDSFPSVLSQVRQAARTWNGVPTSALRVTFGGLFSLDTPQSVPGGEIVFDDEIPPGLLAFSTHTVATAPIQGGDGNFFFPITRAIIHMHQDLTQLPGPSFSEGFFLTVVHEMGHALGLQHTFTSSVMSTAVTRGVTLLHPLDVDDMAAISLLYPNNVAALTGTVSGTVTAGGAGVHLASVVAIRAGGGAVSTLTNPDGTYQIQGIPPGQYFLYVHPLPPTANIVFPLDPDGKTVNSSGPFTPLFYPNTPNVSQATAMSVTAGATLEGKNFSVQPRSDLLISDVSTYSYFGNNAVHPAFLATTSGIGTFVAAGNGLGSNGFAAQGLGLQVLGGSVLVRPGGLRGYGSTPTYLAVDLQFGLGVTTGRQHLVFSRDNYVYVLPSGLNLVTKQPPSIATITPVQDGKGNSSLALTGDNLTPGSLVYFDGLPGTTTIVDAQHASVVPPPGASGQRSTVTVFSQDGQNSVFVASGALPTYQYATQDPAPAVTVSPNNLPAGSEAMVDITGTNTNFVPGVTTIGFGSSDVFVRRLWVLSPTHVIANVAVLPPAPMGPTTISALSGFQVVTQKAGFQSNASDPTLPVAYPQLINGIWLPSGVYPGAIASLFGSNLGDSNSKTRITMNGEPVTLLYVSPNQINLVVPADLKIGPAILTLNNGTRDAYPVVMAIDPAPPVISGVLNQAGGSVSGAATAVLPGDTLTVAVAGLSASADAGSVHLIVGGVDHQANTISQPVNGIARVQFTLADNVPAGDAVPLSVSFNGLTSLPVYISIHPAN